MLALSVIIAERKAMFDKFSYDIVLRQHPFIHTPISPDKTCARISLSIMAHINPESTKNMFLQVYNHIFATFFQVFRHQSAFFPTLQIQECEHFFNRAKKKYLFTKKSVFF